MFYNNIFKQYKTIYDLVKDTMIETKPKGGGAGARLRGGMGDRTSARNVSESENKSVCLNWEENVWYGSSDPSEYDYAGATHAGLDLYSVGIPMKYSRGHVPISIGKEPPYRSGE
jgi:hypothetical protein